MRTIEDMRAVIVARKRFITGAGMKVSEADPVLDIADTLMRALREACGTDEDMEYCIAQAQGEGGGE